MRTSPLAAFSAVVLLAPGTYAADLTTSESYARPAAVVGHQRVVCDEFDRCWREPGYEAVILERDRYAPMPRGGIVERRYYNGRPETTGIHPPGADVEVGDDRW